MSPAVAVLKRTTPAPLATVVTSLSAEVSSVAVACVVPAALTDVAASWQMAWTANPGIPAPKTL